MHSRRDLVQWAQGEALLHLILRCWHWMQEINFVGLVAVAVEEGPVVAEYDEEVWEGESGVEGGIGEVRRIRGMAVEVKLD